MMSSKTGDFAGFEETERLKKLLDDTRPEDRVAVFGSEEAVKEIQAKIRKANTFENLFR